MASYTPIYNPSVPFQSAIVGGISDGKRVIIQGQVHSHAKRFSVNFVCFNNDIAFHFNPRFNEGSVLICNTMQNGIWGSEERKKHMPFQLNTFFEITLNVLGHCIQVSVNGQHILEYCHRVSLHTIQSLKVDGDVNLSCVTFSGQSVPNMVAAPVLAASMAPNMYTAPMHTTSMAPNMYTAPMHTTSMSIKRPVIIHNPIVPFQAAFQRNFSKVRNIIIVGNVRYGADRFQVNLKNSRTGNIHLHINPRFNEGTLVRNTQERNTWGAEERHMSYMPFTPGQNFQMEIRNGGGFFDVYVNGAKIFTYIHRIPPNQIDQIEVAGDLTLTYVQY
ncbi:galectin-4-like isoform X2 [Ascaphus truei]|uniref:galectin-4-like isoform X2 n=1 Tax=Ascaphus truei TaxID=8439 RepID=UPI003F59483E